MSRKLNILIWHVHGAYLLYLSKCRHNFFLPSKPDRRGYYIGRYGHLPWGDNVFDVPAEEVKKLKLDCVVFQLPDQYLIDQHEILSPEQRRLPRVYLEHEPPHEHATEKRHLVADDPATFLVHVTHFNALMWDNGGAPHSVVEHGVPEPAARYTGELARGVTALNNISTRGRRSGYDVYQRVRRELPIDLVGMESAGLLGGLGEIIHRDLPAFEARYRFYFQPMRYASLALAVCEAMMVGLPIVGLATTEMSHAVPNGVAGFVDTQLEPLLERMKDMLREPALARQLSETTRRHARERFHIRRFVADWERVFQGITGA